MSLPSHLFWFLLVCASVLWYASLIVYIGWKGVHDIRIMLAGLRKPSHRADGAGTTVPDKK